MSSRTYLSIGDVLTLLRQEFPDVTISKIRFLESQGLVNPERSPSGYRKFFDHDVERLRWVLRQQREHFLPLKVIRDRLDAGDLDDSGPEEQAGTAESAANGKSKEPDGSAQGRGPGPAATAGTTTAATGTADTSADDEAMARILADASRRAALRPDAAGGVTATTGAADTASAPVVPPERVGAHPASESRRQHERERAAGAAASAAAASATAKRDRTGEAGRDRSRDRAAATENEPRSPAASGPDAAAAPGTGRPHGQGPRPERAVPGLPAAMVTGASLTAEELCAASSLSAEELAGLESYGLVEATTVAGLRTYDEDALTVANLAASFRAFGIEPRHLRQYRNAADREIGLIEQVVVPLLRQRNPESRQRAADGAEQLATLGESMRSTLLRVSLRRHLGG